MTSAHLDALYQCLRGALDPGTQKQAEAALEEFAARPGCCSCLVVTLRGPVGSVLAYCLGINHGVGSGCTQCECSTICGTAGSGGWGKGSC